jgi:hypothetical protein
VKHRILALLLAVVAGGFCTPASAKVVLFNGVLGGQAASPACYTTIQWDYERARPPVLRATYRPAGVGDNGPSTALILMPMAVTLNDLFVSSFTLPNASLNGTYRQVSVSEARSNGLLALSFKQYSAQMRVTRQEPANIDGADFLTLTVQVHNFGNVANCTVTLRGVVGVQFQDGHF